MKTASQIFFTLYGCSLVVNGETDKILGVVVQVSFPRRLLVFRKTHFSSWFPGPLIVHGLPVSCPFNFPNGNLKQQWSHIGVFTVIEKDHLGDWSPEKDCC